MATWTIVVPPSVDQELIDSICLNFDYQDTVMDEADSIPNPESKGQFAKRMTIKKWFKGNIKIARNKASGEQNETDTETLDIT